MDVFDGSMAILVPLTPTAAETMNGGVIDLYPTRSGDKCVDRTKFSLYRQKPTMTQILLSSMCIPSRWVDPVG